jgi:peroxiredoxin
MGETAAQVRPWLDARGLTFPALLDQQNAVGALYQLRAQPSTFVIDQEGIIQEIFYGPVTARRLEAALQPLLAS